MTEDKSWSGQAAKLFRLSGLRLWHAVYALTVGSSITITLRMWLLEKVPKGALWLIAGWLLVLNLLLIAWLIRVLRDRWYETDEATGVLVSRVTGKHFCPKCVRSTFIGSGVKREGENWRCPVCNERYFRYVQIPHQPPRYPQYRTSFN